MRFVCASGVTIYVQINQATRVPEATPDPNRHFSSSIVKSIVTAWFSIPFVRDSLIEWCKAYPMGSSCALLCIYHRSFHTPRWAECPSHLSPNHIESPKQQSVKVSAGGCTSGVLIHLPLPYPFCKLPAETVRMRVRNSAQIVPRQRGGICLIV